MQLQAACFLVGFGARFGGLGFGLQGLGFRVSLGFRV